MRISDKDYIEAKKLLDNLTQCIDAAPMSAKPVFPGIIWLHDLVQAYEAQNAPAA